MFDRYVDLSDSFLASSTVSLIDELELRFERARWTVRFAGDVESAIVQCTSLMTAQPNMDRDTQMSILGKMIDWHVHANQFDEARLLSAPFINAMQAVEQMTGHDSTRRARLRSNAIGKVKHIEFASTRYLSLKLVEAKAMQLSAPSLKKE